MPSDPSFDLSDASGSIDERFSRSFGWPDPMVKQHLHKMMISGRVRRQDEIEAHKLTYKAHRLSIPYSTAVNELVWHLTP